MASGAATPTASEAARGNRQQEQRRQCDSTAPLDQSLRDAEQPPKVYWRKKEPAAAAAAAHGGGVPCENYHNNDKQAARPNDDEDDDDEDDDEEDGNGDSTSPSSSPDAARSWDPMTYNAPPLFGAPWQRGSGAVALASM